MNIQERLIRGQSLNKSKLYAEAEECFREILVMDGVETEDRIHALTGFANAWDKNEAHGVFRSRVAESLLAFGTRVCRNGDHEMWNNFLVSHRLVTFAVAANDSDT